VADAALAFALGVLDQDLHLGAGVAVEAVALDDGGVDVLAVEDGFEGVLDRRGPRAGRAGDRDDRVLHGHGVLRRWRL